MMSARRVLLGFPQSRFTFTSVAECFLTNASAAASRLEAVPVVNLETPLFVVID